MSDLPKSQRYLMAGASSDVVPLPQGPGRPSPYGGKNSCTPELTCGLEMLGWTGNPEVWALASDREFIQSLSWDPMVL